MVGFILKSCHCVFVCWCLAYFNTVSFRFIHTVENDKNSPLHMVKSISFTYILYNPTFLSLKASKHIFAAQNVLYRNKTTWWRAAGMQIVVCSQEVRESVISHFRIHPCITDSRGCFPVLAVLGSAAMNKSLGYLLGMLLFSWHALWEVRILSHGEVLS